MNVDRGMICRWSITIACVVGVVLLYLKAGDIWMAIVHTQPPNAIDVVWFLILAAMWVIVLIVPLAVLNWEWKTHRFSDDEPLTGVAFWMIIVFAVWGLSLAVLTYPPGSNAVIVLPPDMLMGLVAWLNPVVAIYALNILTIVLYELVARRACRVILGGKKPVAQEQTEQQVERE